MSRGLFATAVALFAVAALAPLLVMVGRIEGADLVRIVEPRVHALFLRTLALGLGAAGLALVLGVPYGYAVARTDLPLARWLRTLGVVPLLLPPLFLAMTWTVLVDWTGLLASVWVLGLSGFPLVAIFTARAAERVDQRLVDAARLAGGVRAALRVDAALIAPPALAGAALAFVFAVNDFAVPNYVSFVGPKFNVYADDIFASWNQAAMPGLAVAKSLPLLALNLAALVPALALRKAGAFASLGSGFREPGRWRLGVARWPAFVFVLAVLAAGALVPIGRLVYETGGGPRHFTDVRVAEVLGLASAAPLAEGRTQGPAAPDGAWAPPEELPSRSFGERVAAAPALLTDFASSARAAFRTGFDRARDDILRSYRHALGAAVVAVLVGLVLGHGIERLRRRSLGKGLELLVLLPLAAPATLFGIGAIVLWARPETQGLYQGPYMPTLLFGGRLLPFAVLILSGAVASLDRNLEHAAAVAGIGPVRRLFTVVAPLVLGSIAGAFALVFAFAMRELDSAILVPAANRTAIVRVFNGVHFGRDDFVAALALVLVLSVLLPGLLWSAFAKKPMQVLP
ncbi:MAG: ABC transporter permease subunit [Planctomycetaceae bacterium]|nr:ABC transporter permease subunit [Planctomycetaceae bacterium]